MLYPTPAAHGTFVRGGIAAAARSSPRSKPIPTTERAWRDGRPGWKMDAARPKGPV